MPCRAAIETVHRTLPAHFAMSAEALTRAIRWWHHDTILEALELLTFEGRVVRKISTAGSIVVYRRLDSRQIMRY